MLYQAECGVAVRFQQQNDGNGTDNNTLNNEQQQQQQQQDIILILHIDATPKITPLLITTGEDVIGPQHIQHLFFREELVRMLGADGGGCLGCFGNGGVELLVLGHQLYQPGDILLPNNTLMRSNDFHAIEHLIISGCNLQQVAPFLLHRLYGHLLKFVATDDEPCSLRYSSNQKMLLCKTIIMTYPSMANLADTEGNLPVHILAESTLNNPIYLPLLQHLIHQHPNTLQHLNNHNNIPLLHVAKLVDVTVHNHAEDVLLSLVYSKVDDDDNDPNLALEHIPASFQRLRAKVSTQAVIHTPDLSCDEEFSQISQPTVTKTKKKRQHEVSLFQSHLTDPANSAKRPRRLIVKRTPYDPSEDANSANKPLTGSGFACPMCDCMCDYMCEVCESCGSHVSYRAGIGPVVCVQRDAILADVEKINTVTEPKKLAESKKTKKLEKSTKKQKRRKKFRLETPAHPTHKTPKSTFNDVDELFLYNRGLRRRVGLMEQEKLEKLNGGGVMVSTQHRTPSAASNAIKAYNNFVKSPKTFQNSKTPNIRRCTNIHCLICTVDDLQVEVTNAVIRMPLVQRWVDDDDSDDVVVGSDNGGVKENAVIHEDIVVGSPPAAPVPVDVQEDDIDDPSDQSQDDDVEVLLWQRRCQFVKEYNRGLFGSMVESSC